MSNFVTRGLGKFFNKNGTVLSLYLLIAVTVWVALMIVLPQLFMLDFSFRYNLAPRDVGTYKDVWNIENYRFLIFGSPNNPDPYNVIDVSVFGRTILVAFFVTILDLVLCYPVAFYLAHVAKGGVTRLMVLSLIVPFWVNELLRAFAFRILFGSTGVINQFLIWTGLIDTPFDFIRADVALYAGLGYAYILLMIFPLYNAIESLDKNQLEAATDLGCPWWRTHLRVVIPFAKPGIASGCTMVFMLSAGALAAPQILGGPSSLWFTQIIYQWFNTGGNWPRGSAYAFVLLIICIVFVMLVMRFFKVRFGEIAK